MKAMKAMKLKPRGNRAEETRLARLKREKAKEATENTKEEEAKKADEDEVRATTAREEALVNKGFRQGHALALESKFCQTYCELCYKDYCQQNGKDYHPTKCCVCKTDLGEQGTRRHRKSVAESG
jgi:hypothetical protein